MTTFYKTGSGKVVIGVGVVLVALLAYYAIATKGGATVAPVVTTVAVVENDHMRGATSPKATIVEYGDLQCPACGAYESVVQGILAKYPNDVRVVFRHFPLTQIHQNALLAAKFTEAAAIQGKFWEMHDLLYEKQDEWGNLAAPLSREQVLTYFKTYASQLSLDVNKFTTAIETNEAINIINEDISAGTASGVNATPTFFVNNTKITEPSFAAIKKEIDRVLQK